MVNRFSFLFKLSLRHLARPSPPSAPAQEKDCHSRVTGSKRNRRIAAPSLPHSLLHHRLIAIWAKIFQQCPTHMAGRCAGDQVPAGRNPKLRRRGGFIYGNPYHRLSLPSLVNADILDPRLVSWRGLATEVLRREHAGRPVKRNAASSLPASLSSSCEIIRLSVDRGAGGRHDAGQCMKSYTANHNIMTKWAEGRAQK